MGAVRRSAGGCGGVLLGGCGGYTMRVVVMQTSGSQGPAFNLPTLNTGGPAILPRMGETLRLSDGYSYLVTNVLYSLFVEGTRADVEEIRVMVKRK